MSQEFDNCAKGEGKGMKVYLRIRPMSSKGLTESTITVDSGKELHDRNDLNRIDLHS